LHELLTKRWIALATRFSSKSAIKFLDEIVHAYSRSKRHYHNTDHITALLELSYQYEHKLVSKAVVDFAIYYHDIVYKVPGSDNEHKSAVLAASRLKQMQVPDEMIGEVCAFIEATKSHDLVQVHNKTDLEYFLDFDMSILGAEWGDYLTYISRIRKEYALYPDLVYNPARKKFLNSTLNKPQIFLTEEFKERFEDNARRNMERELRLAN